MNHMCLTLNVQTNSEMVSGESMLVNALLRIHKCFITATDINVGSLKQYLFSIKKKVNDFYSIKCLKILNVFEMVYIILL